MIILYAAGLGVSLTLVACGFAAFYRLPHDLNRADQVRDREYDPANDETVFIAISERSRPPRVRHRWQNLEEPTQAIRIRR